MKKSTIVLWIFVLLGFYAVAHSADTPEGTTGGNTAVRVYSSDGNNRCPFSVLVGSVNAVSPYDLCASTGPQQHRVTVVENPSSFSLYVGTWVGFSDSQAWFVPPSSGTWTTRNHQKFWMRYPKGGGSSDTVKGLIEYE